MAEKAMEDDGWQAMYDAVYDYAKKHDCWFALHLRYPGNDRITLMRGEMTQADLPRRRATVPKTPAPEGERDGQ